MSAKPSRRTLLKTAGLAILLVPLVGAVAGPPAEAMPQTSASRPTVDQILDRYVRALGGEQAIRRFATRVMKGTLELQLGEGGVVKGELQRDAKAPNKVLVKVTVRADTDVPVVDVSRGFDGTVAWEVNGSGVYRQMGGMELSSEKLAADFYHDIRLKEIYTTMKVIGEKPIGTRRAYVIDATLPDGNADRLYFDVRSGLLIRKDGLDISELDRSPSFTWFDEYREVDGIRVACVVRHSSAGRTIVYRFEEIKHDVPLDDSLFTTSDPALAAAATDEYISSEMAKRRIPGLALVVITDGAIAKEQAYGLANLETDTPVTPDTVFELASVTKQFTATAIMRLAEKGRLKLNDPIARYLPSSPVAWKAITIRHLLTHTAGLRSGFEKSLYARIDVTRAETLQSLTTVPLHSRPGEQYRYSDPGYFLLGMIIEAASGQAYRDFLAEQFFVPLGMTSTTVIDQWKVVKHRAAGYAIRNDQLVNIRRIWQDELPAHWGVMSTVRDLAKWEIALGQGRVIGEASLREMSSPVTLNSGRTYPYGFGWFLGEAGGHRVVFHPGASGTDYYRLPDDRMTVIVLTNLGTAEGSDSARPWGIAAGVARRLLAGRP